MKAKERRPTSITVREFFDHHEEELELKLLGSEVGMERKIHEPTINRPALALSGFLKYFAFRRVQVVGNSDQSYLKELSDEVRRERFAKLCDQNIPCIVCSRGRKLPEGLSEIAEEAGISVFGTPMVTMKFINRATLALESDFAPSVSMHGSMVDIQGIGILIMGGSGSGKSESVLGLLERGGSLVADDLVHLKLIDGEIIGNAPDHGRYHMEIRGLGIINVPALFGVGAMRVEKQLNLIINLVPVDDMNNVDRSGVERKTLEVLGEQVPWVEIPVAPGRDIAGLIEIAALDQKLRDYGHDAAFEFNKSLLARMGKMGKARSKSLSTAEGEEA